MAVAVSAGSGDASSLAPTTPLRLGTPFHKARGCELSQGSQVHRSYQSTVKALEPTIRHILQKTNSLDQEAFEMLPSSPFTLYYVTISTLKKRETSGSAFRVTGTWSNGLFQRSFRFLSHDGSQQATPFHRDSPWVRRPTRHSSALNQTAWGTFFPRSRLLRAGL